MALVGEPDHFGGGSYAPSDLEQLRAEEIDQLAALPSPIVVEGAKLFSPSKTSRPENRKFVLFAVDPLIMACIDYDRKIDSIQRALANSQKLADEASLKPVALDLKDFRRLRGRGQSLFDYQSTIDNVKSADSPLLPTGGLGSGLGSSADSCSSVEREELCRDMMLRTVTTLTCFSGFQLSSSSVLEVLSDAAIGHLRRLCVHLRKARDHELLVGQHGFADCLDRTLTDCGCEGISGVLNHYHRSVISRCSALLEEHRKLCNEYTERSLDTDDNSAVEESLLEDILSETSSAAIGLQNLTASGTIDMSHFPNLSFVSAEDEHVKREAPVSSNVPDGVVLKQEQMFPDT